MSREKGRQEVPKWKKDVVAGVVSKLGKASIVGVFDMKSLPSDYLKKLRFDHYKDFEVIIVRKHLLYLALKELGWDELANNLGNMPGVIITENNPFKLYKMLTDAKAKAFAKPGQIAPEEIKVPKGPTPVPAGPALGDFQKAGIPAKIENGKISVIKDTVVVPAGEEISEDIVAVLQKLDIKPMTINLNVLAVKEGDVIYKPDVLAIDEAEVFNQFVTAHSWAFNLAVESKYPCKDTIDVLLLDAHQRAKQLALSEAITEPGVIEDLLALSALQANNLGGEEVEYVYAAMLLHKAGQEINEDSITKVLTAAGAKPDSARVKALVASLEGVDIEEAISKAPAMTAAPAPAAPAGNEQAAEKKEEPAEDEGKTEEEAASGLAALFG